MNDGRLLAIDVGNTRAKFGVFRTCDDGPALERNTAVRLADAEPSRQLRHWLTSFDVRPSQAVVSGSNPPFRDKLLSDWPSELPSPCVVTQRHQIPISVDVRQPDSVGLDRLLTAFAGRRLFAPDQPLIVVDSGTATTVNAVNAEGAFVGGAILPGLRLSARALHEYTARLPLLNTDRIADRVTDDDVPALGGDTLQAITSGLFWGQLGAIRELRTRITEQLDQAGRSTAGPKASDRNTADRVRCIVTGGGGRQLSDHLQPCTCVDSLTLYGLALLPTEKQDASE